VSEDDGWLFESGYDVRTDEWIVRARNGSEVARVAEVVRSSSWAVRLPNKPLGFPQEDSDVA
jgi:hypothetical protein